MTASPCRLDFTNGALGVIHASRWATGHLNELRLRVYGDKGGVEVVHTSDGSELEVCLGEDIETATWQDVDAGSVPTNYQRFADAVRNGVQDRAGVPPRGRTCRRCSTLRSSPTSGGLSSGPTRTRNDIVRLTG